MLFRPIIYLVSSVLFTQAALAALTPDQVVTNVGIVTSISGDLNSILSGLTNVETPAHVVNVAKTVTTDLESMISKLLGDLTARDATTPFTDDEAEPIVDALRHVLLSTVIGKQTIFAQFGLTGPIAEVLRRLEARIDSFSSSMTDLVPTRKDEVASAKASLDSSVRNAYTKYEEICIPSPLYPAVPPVCASL
ncbi:hypothetical protein M413DRAFT_423909 [Hebeloma cylindrosporum]|uniref:Cell wall galactomannoprotein n=1 Tax=Hebeloma cylindrosporum TaxID=76867 RepID=A0A0C3C053_HEBCY|nr:hypothetical protein M413DRAFT_423909 [Hebeloma cylindrosporum h7]